MTSFRYVPSEESKGGVSPSRHSSGPLIAAFKTLDTNRQGFFPKDILLHILTTKGSVRLDPDLVEGVLEEVSIGGRVYYKDICELFKKTSLMAEAILEGKLKSGETTNEKREVELTDAFEEVYEPIDPLLESKQTILSQDTSESLQSLERSSIPTPTQRPNSASVDIPFARLVTDESLVEPTATPAASEMEYDVTLNPNTNEAAIDSGDGSLENIPELLKRATTSKK